MNAITPEIVATVAALGRLKLTPDEVESATEKLAGILDNFSSIQAIDTATTPPADDVSGRKNAARPDVSAPETLASHAALLEGAPAVEDTQIKVQSIF